MHALILGWAILAQISSADFTIKLRGNTGEEQVKIVSGSYERTITLSGAEQTLTLPEPMDDVFTINFLNDMGPRDVYLLESSLEVLGAWYASFAAWNCGASNENHRCQLVRDGSMLWNGEYRFTVQRAVGEVYSGMDVKPGTFLHHAQSHLTGIVSDAACQARCNEAAGCTAWVRAPSSNRCWLSAQTGPIEFIARADRNSGLGNAWLECDGGSVYTENLLAKMDKAQEDFSDCDRDIRDISSTLGKLTYVSWAVKKATESMDSVTEKINGVIEKVVKPPPKGLGIADMLGKVPKVGIFIKMGMKTAEKAMSSIEPLTEQISNIAKRVDDAVDIMDNIFTGLKVVSIPTTLYLKGTHAILEAAHNCAQASDTGYSCGTKAAKMEAKNKEKYPRSSDELEKIALVGRTCHAVLNPMDALLKELAKVAEYIKEHVLDPILEVLEAVEDFVDEMNQRIQDFMDALAKGAAAQCALEVFVEPGSDVLNVVTCPVDEAYGALMHFVVDQLTNKIGHLLQTAANSGITWAVDALVPDNLDIYIPDFTVIVPTDLMLDWCSDASTVFPELHTVRTDINTLALPFHTTGEEIENSILSQALFPVTFKNHLGTYQSYCVAAWKEMGSDFENCKKVLADIEAAAKKAACETAKAAYEADRVAVNAAQVAVNDANAHFKAAQADFNKANSDLQGAQSDLSRAQRSVAEKKSSCPNCRCGGCKWSDAKCHAESAWCCPAKHTCLAAMNAAQGAVFVASKSVSAAQATVHATSAAYTEASQAMTQASNELNYHEQKANQSRAALNSMDCDRRRVERMSPLTKRLLSYSSEDLEAPAAA